VGPGAPDWPTVIAAAMAGGAAPVSAKTYIRKWGSASRPIALSCDDGLVYVVKGSQAGRQAVNDHIVGHLGLALGAPTGRPALVRVGQALIDAESELRDLHGSGPFVAGVWHGCQHLGNVSDDREGFLHQGVPENRPRYGRLAILYGWAYSQDHRFLFNKAEPRLVFSVDHGHFFPGGPDWTAGTLAGHANTPAVPDPAIVGGCALTHAELRGVVGALEAVREAAIVGAVAAPLPEWGLSMDERVAMARHLARRRGELLAAVAALPA
jgi:hypothetical protein